LGRQIPMKERVVVVAAGALYLGLLASSVVSPIFLEWPWTPLIGLFMGLSEASLRISEDTSPYAHKAVRAKLYVGQA